jgi:hypothetical protein
MDNVTIADVLKIKGEWTESSKLDRFVSEKLEISERQARRKIKEAATKRKILKFKLPESKIVLYGLASFGSPEDHYYKVMYFDCGLDKAFGDKPRIKS